MLSEEDFKKCETERDEYLNGWKRAKADFANYQKDEGKRLEEAGKFLTAGMMVELINVLDSFAALELSYKGEPRPDELSGRDAAGFMQIGKQLEQALKKFGLEPIAVEAGQKFDPALHEAVAVGGHPEEQGDEESQSKDSSPPAQNDKDMAPVSDESSAGEQNDNNMDTILEELQKGYKLNGRVIRASKVKISK